MILYLPLGVFSQAGVRPEVPGGQVPDVEAGDDLAVLVVPDGDRSGVSGLDLTDLIHDTLVLP